MNRVCFMNSKPAMRLKAVFAVLLVAAALAVIVTAAVSVTKDAAREMQPLLHGQFTRVLSEEEPDEDLKKYPVEYEFLTGDIGYTLTVEYTPEEYAALPENAELTGYVYADGHRVLTFSHVPEAKELAKAQRALYVSEQSASFGIAMACALSALGLCVMLFFGRFFTNYEQIWFISILVLAAVFSLLFPEEEANGVNGLVIMALYLLDTFLNILCELLISKQSKWNFIVSVFVEITEIVICLVLMYRFATMATTLFFWLPCDIISFINWHRHPDKQQEELTVVRTLKGWQEVLIVAGIVVWTLVVGYFLSNLDFLSDFIQNRSLAVAIAYMDACASAVGVVNGLFILFRLREQWIAWYICAALEAAINVLSGQFVLLILKLGYFTNTTYGYIKWTKYIRGAEKKETE